MTFGARRRSPRLVVRGELHAPTGYDALVTVGMGLSGPVAIWSARAGGDGEAEPLVALTAYAGAGAPAVVVEVGRLPFAFPHVQVLPDETFLVVGARCGWHPEGPEQNAVVYADDGRELRRGTLGDGIEHVVVGADGRIWVGYFDEGVYGNCGWGEPGGPPPLGAPGIVAWTAGLDQAWALDPAQGLVSDCYALNVAEDAVWACPYMDFPVVAITGDRVRTWPTEDVGGPRGIVVDRDRVALIGSYADPSAFVHGRLEGGRFVEQRRGSLRAPDGTGLPTSTIHCTGPVAHFFAGRTWLSLDLRDLG